MIWILALLGLPILIYTLFVRPFQHWKKRGVQQYSVGKLWLEILFSFIPYRSMPDSIKMMYNEFPDKRYFGGYQFHLPTLVLRDPELIKQITVKDFDHFTDHNDVLPVDSEVLWQKNLFVLKGDNWRDMRSTLSPSFTTNKLKTMFGLMSDCIKNFVDYFERKNKDVIALDIKSAFEKLTNDVIATTAFGITCNSLKDPTNEFYLMGKDLTNFGGFWLNIKILFILLVPKLSKIFGVKFFKQTTTDFFTQLLTENIEAREKHGITRTDMINLLLEARKNRAVDQEVDQENENKYFALGNEPVAKDKSQKPLLTNEDILAQAMIFFFAGFESVSVVMSFAAYELALHPDIQEKLLREIQEVARNGEIGYEHLAKMKYLDMVINESMRKYPAAFVIDRVCVKPYTIQAETKDEEDVNLKVGDVLWLPIVGIQCDPKYFPDPDRFDPERFSDENKDSITPYTFLAFGTGPRHCVGFRFALMEIKLAFIHLLSKFEIVVVDKTPIPMKFAKSQFKLIAEDGFWIGLKARKNEMY